MNSEEVLRSEFAAEEGSFLLQLRTELRWDPAAFDRLAGAMRLAAANRSPDAPIPRWLAEGFWYLDTFVRDWTSHDNFPRPLSPEYYESAYELISDLAYWLFVGENPKRDE